MQVSRHVKVITGLILIIRITEIIFIMEVVFTAPPNDTVFKAVTQRLADMVDVPITRIDPRSISPVSGKELTYLVEFVIIAPSNGKELSSAEILRRLTEQYKTNPDSIPVLLQENAPTVKEVSRLEGVPPANPRIGVLIPPQETSGAGQNKIYVFWIAVFSLVHFFNQLTALVYF